MTTTANSINRAVQQAEKRRRERVEEVAEALLEGETPDASHELLKEAAELAKSRRTAEVRTEIQKAAESKLEDLGAGISERVEALGALDSEIAALRTKLVEKIAERQALREEAVTLRSHRRLLARSLDLELDSPAEVPDETPAEVLNLAGDVEHRVDRSEQYRRSVRAVEQNRRRAARDGDVEGVEGASRQLRDRLPDEVARLIAGDVAEALWRERAEERRSLLDAREILDEARTWAKVYLSGRDPGPIPERLPESVKTVLRDVRSSMREFTHEGRDAEKELRAAVYSEFPDLPPAEVR